MRITIECDSGSGSANPAVSTVDQIPGALAAPVTVNAGAAAPGAPGSGAEGGAAVGTIVDAGAAPPFQKTAKF